MNEEQIAMLAKAGIDYESGLDRFDGNEQLFEKFIKRFYDDTNLDKLRKALDQDDTEGAYRVAHAQKGVVGTLSFTRYYSLISLVSESLRNGNIESAKENFGAVEKAHADVLAAILCLS